MKFRFLSSAPAGSTLEHWTTQDALPIETVTNPNWGSSDTPSGEPISIILERSLIRNAPDSVGFSVDLSASLFDTPAPSSSIVYDRQFHELEYYWTFGEPGTWSAPINTPDAWKNRDFAYGPFVRHLYRASGTYTATVMVVEPSSGKMATATIDIVVEDSNVVFAGNKTICINNIGDNDFSAAPVGAQTINADEFITEGQILTLITPTANNRREMRLLFKSGWTGIGRANISNARFLTISTYGGSDPATFLSDTVPIKPNGSLYACLYKQGYAWQEYVDLNVSNIRFQGPFDEVAAPLPMPELGRPGAIFVISPIRYIFSNCVFNGFPASCNDWQPNNHPSNPSGMSMIHFDDNIVTNFGGQFANFWAAKPDSGAEACMTGCRVMRRPDSITEFEAGQRALLRNKHCDKVHIRGNDMFNNDGVQACLRLVDTDVDGHSHLTIHTNALESVGAITITMSANSPDRADPFKFKATMVNGIVESNIIVGGWRTVDLMLLFVGGLTIRNNLCIVPNMMFHINPTRSVIAVENEGNTSTIQDWPTRIYNNTVVSLRSPANNNNTIPTAILVSPEIPQVIENNIIHQPNVSPAQIDFVPLSENVLFASRNEGYRPVHYFVKQYLSNPVAQGQSFSVDYPGPASNYLPANDASHTVNRTYSGEVIEFALSFGDTQVTIRNIGTKTWPAGWLMEMKFIPIPGYYPPKNPAFASGNIVDFSPLDGSAALGAALREPSAERDITGQFRPVYPSKGAWEMP